MRGCWTLASDLISPCPRFIPYTLTSLHGWIKGFRYFICSLNYAGAWAKGSISELKSQYSELAEFYYNDTIPFLPWHTRQLSRSPPVPLP